MIEYIQNIRQSHRLHRRSQEKQESRFKSGVGWDVSQGKNTKSRLQDRCTSTLLMIIVMMPPTFKKYTGGCTFIKSQERVNYIIEMNEIKLLAKKKKNWWL